MPKIDIMRENKHVAELPLDNSEVLIGRGDDCHIVLQDSLASWHHAKIIKAYGGYLIEDLKSTNGVTINGRKISKQLLKYGDNIVIGIHDLHFNKSADDKTVEPEKTMLASSSAEPSSVQKRTHIKLRFLNGPDSGLSQSIVAFPHAIDKSDGNSATIVRKGDTYVLQRLSGNRVTLNDQPVSIIGSQLKNDDKIQVGGDEMRFLLT